MRDVSDRWLATSKTGGQLLAELTCHPPVGEPLVLTMASASVEQKLGTGQRWSASIDVQPQIGEDTWNRVSWPGAWFTLRVGFRYGPTAEEWIPYGVYVHDDHPEHGGEQISLRLGDRWSDLDRARFDQTTIPPAAQRTWLVERVGIRDALGGDQPVSIRVSDAGSTNGETEWDERTKLIEDLSKDGDFDAYFDADGVFVMAPTPSGGRALATFTDGQDGANIVDLTRGARFTRFYNRVAVYPQDQGEEDEPPPFTIQTATLDEPNHPLDPRNMRGLRVVYKHASPTIDNNQMARHVARQLLIKALRQAPERQVSTFLTAHIDVGDTVSTALRATQTEAGSVSSWLVTGTSFDPLTGESSLTLATSAEPEMTEEAG